MKVTIEVKDKGEKRAVELALADPSVRALVLTMGYLITLPSDRSRARVLSYVADLCSENDKNRSEEPESVDAVDPQEGSTPV